MKGIIYKLVNPETSLPIYIGHTIRNLKDRLKEHLSSKKFDNRLLYNYLYSEKITPAIQMLEEVEISNSKELRQIELEWIEKFAQEGIKLFNHNKPLKYSGSIKVDWGVYDRVRTVCAKEGMSISRFYDNAAIERLKKFEIE